MTVSSCCRTPKFVNTLCTQNQIPKEYYKAYFAATEPMFVKPREFKLLNRMGPEYFVAKK